MTTPDLNITSKDLVEALCFNYQITEENRKLEYITIECNWCVTEDYIFFDGKECETPDEDWLARAVTHINKHHHGRLATK